MNELTTVSELTDDELDAVGAGGKNSAWSRWSGAPLVDLSTRAVQKNSVTQIVNLSGIKDSSITVSNNSTNVQYNYGGISMA